MTVSLSKGQSIDLSKTKPGLRKVSMGLGWDAAKPRGFLSKLLGGKPAAIDLDASCIALDASGGRVDVVWFQNLTGAGGAIHHTGDNLTGDGDGDDETISVDLGRLPREVAALGFTVNSFRGQTFDEVENAVCRLVDEGDGREICRYELNRQGPHTGVVMAVVVRQGDGWTMKAIGEPADGRTAMDMVAACARHAR